MRTDIETMKQWLANNRHMLDALGPLDLLICWEEFISREVSDVPTKNEST